MSLAPSEFFFACQSTFVVGLLFKRLSSVLPSRLFDCQEERLKEKERYLQDTNGAAPRYTLVSHVWGDPEYKMTLPSVDWAIPITDDVKWNVILGHCKRENVKWLWMDIICINQSDSAEGHADKKEEIAKMGQYYQQAQNCLVVPDDYINFGVAYADLMDLYLTIIEPQEALTDENMPRIWASIPMLDRVITNKWFWKMWTLQELLVPGRHVLLDGQVLLVVRLRGIVAWYRSNLLNKSLKKPPGGTDYDYIHPDHEVVISKNWEAEKMGWNLIHDFKEKGYVDLVLAVYGSRDKGCKLHIDRLLGIYGLLHESETVENYSVAEDSLEALNNLWKAIIHKAILANKVWPLLHDLFPREEALLGDRWIPQMTTLHTEPITFESYPEVLDHRNHSRLLISRKGLEISVRVIGQVVGTSVSIGDGGGERNKLFIWTWALAAHGLNCAPIIQQFKTGIAHSSRNASSEQIEQWNEAIDRALAAPSLDECLRIYEEAELRIKLLYAWDIRGWDRSILVVHINGQKPMVCLAWCHRTDRPQVEAGKCWVLDVSTNPISHVKRWVIANHTGEATFRKIGTVSSHPSMVEGRSISTADTVFE